MENIKKFPDFQDETAELIDKDGEIREDLEDGEIREGATAAELDMLVRYFARRVILLSETAELTANQLAESERARKTEDEW